MTDSRQDTYIKRERRRMGRPSHCKHVDPVTRLMCAAFVPGTSKHPGECDAHASERRASA